MFGSVSLSLSYSLLSSTKSSSVTPIMKIPSEQPICSIQGRLPNMSVTGCHLGRRCGCLTQGSSVLPELALNRLGTTTKMRKMRVMRCNLKQMTTWVQTTVLCLGITSKRGILLLLLLTTEVSLWKPAWPRWLQRSCSSATDALHSPDSAAMRLR